MLSRLLIMLTEQTGLISYYAKVMLSHFCFFDLYIFLILFYRATCLVTLLNPLQVLSRIPLEGLWTGVRDLFMYFSNAFLIIYLCFKIPSL